MRHTIARLKLPVNDCFRVPPEAESHAWSATVSVTRESWLWLSRQPASRLPGGGERAAALGCRAVGELDLLTTERLVLRRPDPDGDCEAMFAVFSDPDGWWYDPDGRHEHLTHTRDWLTRAAQRFDVDGLSY